MESRGITTTSRASAGFTIVELMIATLVFSVVLIMVTVGIVQFTRSYYRGATVAKTQDTARSVMDSISQSIQYGKAQPTDIQDGTPQYFCAGGYQFIFTKGVEYKLEAPRNDNAGVFQVVNTGVCAKPTDPMPTAGRQLLNKNMRVTQLDQSLVGDGLYSVAVTVAYGDDDLLCDGGDEATCQTGAATLSPLELASAGSSVRCKQEVGSEFCAVSTLSTVVKKRVK